MSQLSLRARAEYQTVMTPKLGELGLELLLLGESLGVDLVDL